MPLPPTNYVHLDAQGRVWITVSTRTTPRSDAYRPDIADGFDDLRTAYLGCLLDESIYQFESPYAGHPPTHWNFAGPQRLSTEQTEANS